MRTVQFQKGDRTVEIEIDDEDGWNAHTPEQRIRIAELAFAQIARDEQLAAMAPAVLSRVSQSFKRFARRAAELENPQQENPVTTTEIKVQKTEPDPLAGWKANIEYQADHGNDKSLEHAASWSPKHAAVLAQKRADAFAQKNGVAKHAPGADLVAIAKAAEIQKAIDALPALIEKRMADTGEDRPKATHQVLETPEGRAAYNAAELAKKAQFTAIPISKATEDRIAKAAATMDALSSEEIAFGRAHNLTPAEAGPRLRAVDPTFEKRFRTAYNEHHEAKRAAFSERQEAQIVATGKRYSAERAVAKAAQAEQQAAADAAKVPAQREYEALIAAEVAKGTPAPEATVRVMKTAKGRQLYGLAHEQKIRRSAGHNV